MKKRVNKGDKKKKYRDGGIMDNLGEDYMIGGSGSYFCDTRDPMVENLSRLQAAR